MLNFISYLIGSIIIILILILFYIEFIEFRIKQKCKKQNLKYVRLPSWNLMALFGNLRFDQVITKNIRKYGKVFGFNMWNAFTIVISDPELVQIVCNSSFTKFPNRRNVITNDPIWSNFLFITNDEDWKRLRAIVSPAFSTGKLRKLKFSIDDSLKLMSKNLNEKINNGENIVNVKKFFGAFAMDSIIRISMGIKIDSIQDPNNLIIENAKKLFGHDTTHKDLLIFALGTSCPLLLKLFNLQIQPDALQFLVKVSNDIIAKKREEMLKSKEKATNFIELILEIEQEQKEIFEKNGKTFKYITNDELISQCVTFFTAGYDTTSSVIILACYLLAKHPDIQDKLYNSIIDTIQLLSNENNDNQNDDDPFELINFDTLNRFDYMNAVLNESMRLLTLVFVIDRVATDDVHLETSDKKISFDVKKGDIIRISPNDLHMDPNNFYEPEKFIPERFLPENISNPDKKFNKYAFIPFGTGPRKCVATNLALFEVKLAIIHIFRLYRFSLSEKTKLDFNIVIDSLIPKDLYLHVEKR